MDIYLTETELLREENIFKPHEPVYPSLEGNAWDIRTFKDEVTNDKDIPSIPPS